MKLPENPPKSSIQEIFKSLPPEKSMALVAPSETMKQFFMKVNAKYPYWEQFKQLQMPNGFTPQEMWFALKMFRNPFQMKLPFVDTKQKGFTYFITPTMQALLSKIDQYAAGTFMDENALPSSRGQSFIMSSLMEEAIASSQLEGAVTTRRKAKQMLRTGKKPINDDQRMIMNNYSTIIRIREEWKKETLSPALINKIHQSMTAGTMHDSAQEGAYRTEEDDKEGLAVRDEEGQVLHAPPPHKEIEKLVNQLCIFANSEHVDDRFIHPVVKAIVLHFWLAYIHPFADGNGRTSRALFYWYMLSHKYWLFEYLSISRIILNARGQYIKAFLFTEYDECDLNYFILHQLQAISKAIDDLQEYILIKQAEEREMGNLLKSNQLLQQLNERQRALLFDAIKNPDSVYTVKGHMKMSDVVYETARKDMMDLVDAGFLEMKAEQKEYFFIPVNGLASKIKTKKSF